MPVYARKIRVRPDSKGITGILGRIKAIFILLFLLLLPIKAIAADTSLFDIMIKPRSIAPEWSYVNGFQLSLAQIRDYEDRFSVAINDIRQQYFSLEGVIVEVTYYDTRTQDGMASLFQKLSRLKQRQSFLANIGNIVIDFSSPDYNRAVLLSEKIKKIPDIFYYRFLHSEMPEGWRIIAEIIQPDYKIKEYKKKFLARINAITHQLLLVDGTKVQINIIQSPNIYEEKRLADFLRVNTSKRNLVMEHNNLTIEMVSVSMGRSYAVGDYFRSTKQ
ncbi:hypothetical protein ACFL35_08475 [Candidatus Riflebacteria bacterium]